MTAAEVIDALRTLLAAVPAPLIKDAIDLIDGGHPDPVAEFETRRDAVYAAIQADADRRWGPR